MPHWPKRRYKNQWAHSKQLLSFTSNQRSVHSNKNKIACKPSKVLLFLNDGNSHDKKGTADGNVNWYISKSKFSVNNLDIGIVPAHWPVNPLYDILKEESRLFTKVSIRDVHHGITYKTESNLSGQRQRTHSSRYVHACVNQQSLSSYPMLGTMLSIEDRAEHNEPCPCCPRTELLKMLFSGNISWAGEMFMISQVKGK